MESKPKFRPDGSLRLMEQVRQVLRYYHYAYRAGHGDVLDLLTF